LLGASFLGATPDCEVDNIKQGVKPFKELSLFSQFTAGDYTSTLLSLMLTFGDL
jgi:hypothetical protein